MSRRPTVGHDLSAKLHVDWNPRFVAYAKSQGCADPDAVLDLDRERYPGGCMTGFTLRIPEQWAAWRKLKGYRGDRIMSDQDHAEFDVWLAENDGEKPLTCQKNRIKIAEEKKPGRLEKPPTNTGRPTWETEPT
mgnify:CR=1 FL=1